MLGIEHFRVSWGSPLPTPLCEDRLPDIVTVSRVVIGASIDCDIDMPETSIVGKETGSLSAKHFTLIC